MKIILNILTHGDETVGLEVIREIEKLNIDKNILQFQVANKKAFELKKRFVDQDLNQSFPGKKNGNYEEKLAYSISPKIRLADVVIDIHSTTSNLKDTIIVTKLDKATKKYLDVIKPRYVLIMKVGSDKALISQAKVGLGFEYGKNNDPRALKRAVNDIKRIFYYTGIVKNKLKEKKREPKYFDVVSKVEKPRGYRLLKKIKNYKIIRQGEIFAVKGKKTLTADEEFYPILFGEKNYKDFFGFKGKISKNSCF